MSGHTGKPQQEPINWPRRLRQGFALVLIALLGAALVDFRELLPVGVGHWLASLQLVPALLSLLGGALVPGLVLAGLLLVTLFFGRLYCSVVCPLGILQDLITRAAGLFQRKKRLLPPAREQVWVRHAFVWSSVGAFLFGWGAFALTLVDPYSHFGRIASVLVRPALTWGNNHLVWLAEAAGWNGLYRVDLPMAALGAFVFPSLILGVVVVMAVRRGRLYCNTVCPVGTVLGWVSRHAAFRIRIDADACTKCANCLRSCKAQCIDLKAGAVDFSRCVGCQNCVSACDERGIGYRWSWGRASKALKPVGEGRRALIKGSVGGLFMGGLLASFSSRAKAVEAEGSSISSAGTAKGPTLGERKAECAGVAPPGARSVALFLDRCTACQLCVSACPKHVLQPSLFEFGLKGFMKPRLDFSASFCDYDCRACAEACPDGAIALLPIEEKQLEQIGIARFYEERCIVKVKGTDCAACSEHCPTKAVETIPFGENLRLPQVKESLCIGCGACQFACPVVPEKAILVTGLREHGRAVRALATESGPAAPKPPAGDFPF